MSNIKVLDIKNVRFGEGMPKICIPVIGRTKDEILEKSKAVLSSNPDLVEWRVDYWDELFVTNSKDVRELVPQWRAVLKSTLEEMKTILGDKILLFTFRSKSEGGEKNIDLALYEELNRAAIESGVVDLIDLEGLRLSLKDEKDSSVAKDYVTEIINFAHEKNVKVIGSKHYFDHTPEQQEMVEALMKLQYMDVDMPKLAVMPKTHGDVARLMDATMEMNARFADRPIITMSMAEEGRVSRFMGEAFGSAVTFGTVTEASAPGQINAEGLRKLLELVHSEI